MPQKEAFDVPWDLTEVAEPGTLGAWVEEEIGALNWSNPELIAYLRAHPKYHPRMMLTVLTYAYATGVFESEAIVDRCDSDPVYRRMCAVAAPESVAAIRKFRRENRGLLKWSLVQILRRCLASTSGVGELAVPAGVKRLLIDNAVSRLDLGRHLDRTMHEI